MHHALCYAFVIAVLCWPGLTSAQDETIQFKKGASSATLQGQVSRFIKTYRFHAREGQNVVVTLTPTSGKKDDRGTLMLSLNAFCGEQYGTPLAMDTLRWQGLLTCNGMHTIDVMPSREAQEQARVQRYALTLEIR